MRYGLVGGLTTGLSFCVFIGLARLGLHYLAASTLAWIAAVLVSYALHKRVTFSLRTPASVQEAASFAGGSVLQLLLTSAGYALLIDGVGLGPAEAFVLNVAAGACFNLGFMRLVVFRRSLPLSGL